MMNKLKQYVEDHEFRFTVYSNKIHIINYQKLITLEENMISFQSEKETFVLRGKEFSLKKLLEKEALLIGKVNTIEVYDEK